VGPLAVLGAMVEQKRRASRPDAAEVSGAPGQLEGRQAKRARPGADAAGRGPHDSDGVLKVR
jgi:hypothetical protein